MQLVISNANEGLKLARIVVFGEVSLRRNQFHQQQNAGGYVAGQDIRCDVAEDLRTVFNAPDRYTAEAYLKEIVKKYA